MQIMHEVALADHGQFSTTPACTSTLNEIRTAVKAMVWPPTSDSFVIYPEPGKKKGEGNGVVPVKVEFFRSLKRQGWSIEWREPPEQTIYTGQLGPVDAHRHIEDKDFYVEFETGNISSCHRSANKIAIKMLQGSAIGGVLVLPTANMAQYFTDRISNYEELSGYFPLWRSALDPAKVSHGLMMVIAIEHDGVSKGVDRIPKGKAGRASMPAADELQAEPDEETGILTPSLFEEA